LNYSVFGHNVHWVFLWQLILGVITNLLIYLVTRRYFGDLAAAISGFLAAFFGPMMFFELVLLRSSLAVFFGILAVYLVGTAIQKNTFPWWFLTGIGCGLALLVHAFFMLFIIGALVLLVITYRKSRNLIMRSAGGLLVGAVLVMMPVMIRNMTEGAPVVSLSNTGTLSFVTMNNVKFESFIGWNMSTKFLSEIMGSSNGKLFKAILPTLMTHPSPGSYFSQLWDKIHATFSWFEIPNNVNFYFYREFVQVLWITFISFLVLSPLALIGIVVALMKKINAWPLYLMILVFLFPMLAFMVLARYRIILAPVLIPFAAFTVSELFSPWKGYRNWLVIFSLVIIGYWASKPGDERVHRVTKEDYSGMWSIHYGEPVKKALDQKQWKSIVASLNDYFARYEPDDIKNIKPLYHCKSKNESDIFQFFAGMHESFAFICHQAGDDNAAQKEGDFSKKLKDATIQ
jgi:4-amino-4-deoxy-L-arabinose transferase-like glycosyltransferase